MVFVSEEIKPYGQECKRVIIDDSVYETVLDCIQSVVKRQVDEEDAADWIMGEIKDVALGKKVKIEVLPNNIPVKENDGHEPLLSRRC